MQVKKSIYNYGLTDIYLLFVLGFWNQNELIAR